MQNVIGGYIFHVIKAHDLTQNIFTTQVLFQRKKLWKIIFLQVFHNGKGMCKKRCKQLNINGRKF